VAKVYLYRKWILSLDLGPIPKISHILNVKYSKLLKKKKPKPGTGGSCL
jgi:hypothetical protein